MPAQRAGPLGPTKKEEASAAEKRGLEKATPHPELSTCSWGRASVFLYQVFVLLPGEQLIIRGKLILS